MRSFNPRTEEDKCGQVDCCRFAGKLRQRDRNETSEEVSTIRIILYNILFVFNLVKDQDFDHSTTDAGVE